jgi:hypothetical protein
VGATESGAAHASFANFLGLCGLDKNDFDYFPLKFIHFFTVAALRSIVYSTLYFLSCHCSHGTRRVSLSVVAFWLRGWWNNTYFIYKF